MGVSVRQKRPGRGKPWYVFIHQDKLIRCKKIGPKRQAEAVAAELRRRELAGKLSLVEAETTTAPLFEAYAMRFLDEYARIKLKRTTARSYELIINSRLLPACSTASPRPM